jgi:hypothetical protein
MMNIPAPLLREAMARQGTTLQFEGRGLRLTGGAAAAEFEAGREGLVHLAADETTGRQFRIKCFFEPDERRRRRSERLVNSRLADMNKSQADPLGGAAFRLLPELGPSTPFALLMKNVRGWNWFKLRDAAKRAERYPPSAWPGTEVRMTWAYGLATAVLKMESQGFIHADLSPGNVVVNDGLLEHGAGPTGQNEAGDVALVDFDRFYDSRDPAPPGQGSKGYAASEIWQQEDLRVGSDRTAMSILIQEFLIIGDPDIGRAEALDWSYNQKSKRFDLQWETGNVTRTASAHPLLTEKYPGLAKLLVSTLHARDPDTRPAPQSWRQELRAIIEPWRWSPEPQGLGITIESYPNKRPEFRLIFDRTQQSLDLSKTQFRIRAHLERKSDGKIEVVVQNGATLNIRRPESRKFEQYPGGARVSADPGMVLFDRQGSVNARLDSSESANQAR